MVKIKLTEEGYKAAKNLKRKNETWSQLCIRIINQDKESKKDPQKTI